MTSSTTSVSAGSSTASQKVSPWLSGLVGSQRISVPANQVTVSCSGLWLLSLTLPNMVTTPSQDLIAIGVRGDLGTGGVVDVQTLVAAGAGKGHQQA